MLLALRQYQRRAAFTNGLYHFVTNDPGTFLVCDQFPVQILKLQPHVRIGLCHGTKRRGANVNRVPERSTNRLRFRIDPMSHRTALHEDDRMVAVLARHRRGQSGHKPGLRPTSDQLETPR